MTLTSVDCRSSVRRGFGFQRGKDGIGILFPRRGVCGFAVPMSRPELDSDGFTIFTSPLRGARVEGRGRGLEVGLGDSSD